MVDGGRSVVPIRGSSCSGAHSRVVVRWCPFGGRALLGRSVVWWPFGGGRSIVSGNSGGRSVVSGNSGGRSVVFANAGTILSNFQIVKNFIYFCTLL